MVNQLAVTSDVQRDFTELFGRLVYGAIPSNTDEPPTRDHAAIR